MINFSFIMWTTVISFCILHYWKKILHSFSHVSILKSTLKLFGCLFKILLVTDKLCVWARFDRKLNKDASKRLREFNQQKSDCLKEKQQVSY